MSQQQELQSDMHQHSRGKDTLRFNITSLLPLPRKVVFVICLFVISFAHFQTDLHEIFREGWQWANQQLVCFDLKKMSGKTAKMYLQSLCNNGH